MIKHKLFLNIFGQMALLVTMLMVDYHSAFAELKIGAFAELEIGQPAPSFELLDSNGQTRKLSEFKNKIVVLEWLNHGCPYVRKHYDSENMQKLQADYTAKGIVWLSIASSAEGKEGYMTAEEAKRLAAAKKSAATTVLLDPDGKVGRDYFAKTTPHMYIINSEGILVYQGAIDDQPSTRVSSIEGAKNFVSQALDQLLANIPVSQPQTQPYGCSIKYKS